MAVVQQSFDLSESSKDGLVLEATYFCKAQKDKKVDVVMKLKCSGEAKESKTPQRYVLVIDVSGSMDSQIDPEDSRSLLTRMKGFAELFIHNSPKQNWLSVVTFSDDARILLPMTQMTDEGKSAAREVVKSLETEGGTNLGSGLFKGLDALKEESTSLNQQTRDCIVFFTDGMTNEGILEANELVDKFKEEVKHLRKDGRKSHVQLATVTIGDYQHEFLRQVANCLSTDAFYWLNYKSEIEADMLLPGLLREEACLCDVNVSLSCSTGVTFMEDSLSLLEKMVQVEQIENDKVEFSIGYIPHDVERNISFSLDITTRQPENDVLLEATKQYFDHNLEERTHTDVVRLSTTSMREARKPIKKLRKGKPDVESILNMYSFYLVEDSEVQVSWSDAQLSYMSILEQEIRSTAIQAIEPPMNLDAMTKALESINNELSIAKLVIGDDSAIYAEKAKKISVYSKVVNHEATYANDDNWSRLAAIASSLCKEMPVTSGVFGPGKQIFMTPRVRKLVKMFMEIVRDTSQKFKQPKNRLKYKEDMKKDLAKIKSPYNTPVLSSEHRPENKRKTRLASIRNSAF